jgi:sec-independent protein translocase protein TatB
MFDIGFSELLVIAIVALIVIGPRQLPRVARTLGHLFGRMQRYVNDVKADITREMELDELRKMQSSMEDAARSFQSSVNKGVTETETELNKLAQDAQSAADPYTEAPAKPEPQSGEAAAETKSAPQPGEPAPEAKPQPATKKLV